MAREIQPTLEFYSLLNDTMQIKEELFPSKSQYKKFVGGLLPHLKRHLKSIPSFDNSRCLPTGFSFL